MLKPQKNPILEAMQDPTFDQTKLNSPFAVRGKVPEAREIKKAMRVKTAAEAIGDLYPGCAIFGITKGQFSLIELIGAVLGQTGPADLFLSTWTAAGSDLSDAFSLVESGMIRSMRFLVDHTFQRRKPAFASKIRELFGAEAVRVTRNHAKFCLIRNEQWDIVLKTSMNLNTNPRLEDFDIQDDPLLADFLQGLMDEIFKRIKPKALFDPIADNERRFLKL